MQLKKSYKPYAKLKNFLYIVPHQRVKMFKRTKWKRLKRKLRIFFRYKKKRKQKKEKERKKRNFFKSKKIRGRKKNSKRIFNIFETTLAAKKANYKLLRKDRISLKRSLFAFFGDHVSLSFYKKLLKQNITNKTNFILQLIVKPFYQIEILVWKLGFYRTIFQLKQHLLLKRISINYNPSLPNQIVKAGDIITLSDRSPKSLSFVPTFLCSFLEVDYYSRAIVIVNNWDQVNSKSMFFIYHEMFNLDSFTDYIYNN